MVKFSSQKLATNDLIPPHDTMINNDPSYRNGNDYAFEIEEETTMHVEVDPRIISASEEVAQLKAQLGLMQLLNATLVSTQTEQEESRGQMNPARHLAASVSKQETVDMMSLEPLARHPGKIKATTSISELFRSNRPRAGVLFPQYTPSLVENERPEGGLQQSATGNWDNQPSGTRSWEPEGRTLQSGTRKLGSIGSTLQC